jgi:hypothetical protein
VIWDNDPTMRFLDAQRRREIDPSEVRLLDFNADHDVSDSEFRFQDLNHDSVLFDEEGDVDGDGLTNYDEARGARPHDAGLLGRTARHPASCGSAPFTWP